MAVVYINQTFGRGGAEHFNISLLKYLSQKTQVNAYSNSPQFLQNDTVKIRKIPIAVDLIGDWKGFIKGLFYIFPLFTYYLYIILINNKASVYYFTGYIEKVICTPILKLLGKKVIWIEFGPLNSVFTKFFRIPEYLYRISANFPDICAFSSQNSLTQNQRYFPKDANLTIIHLGSPAPPNTKSLQPFDVLSISRLEPTKGQDLLLAAWAKVIQIVPRAKLIIAGEGDATYTSHLKSLIKLYKLSKSVRLEGYVNNQYSYLKSCKFTVFPSVWPLEGFGLVITESLSMGKPVVAFDRPPGNEIIKSGYNGLLGDSLSENIIKLLSDKRLLNSLSRNAKLSWSQKYSSDIYLSHYANTILS